MQTRYDKHGRQLPDTGHGCGCKLCAASDAPRYERRSSQRSTGMESGAPMAGALGARPDPQQAVAGGVVESGCRLSRGKIDFEGVELLSTSSRTFQASFGSQIRLDFFAESAFSGVGGHRTHVVGEIQSVVR